MEMLVGSFDEQLGIYCNRKHGKMHFFYDFTNHGFGNEKRVAIAKHPEDPKHKIFIALSDSGSVLCQAGLRFTISCRDVFTHMNIAKQPPSDRKEDGEKGFTVYAVRERIGSIDGFTVDLSKWQEKTSTLDVITPSNVEEIRAQ